MRRFVVLLPLLLLTGCGLTDPTVSTQDSAPKPAPKAPTTATSLPPVLARHAATGGASSPQRAAIAYTTLLLNFSLDDKPASLERAISLSSYAQAAATNAHYEATVAARVKSGQFPQGQVLTTTPAPDGPAGFVYVITRTGTYTSEGAPIGSTKVIVYSVRTARQHGRYVVTKWEPTR